MKRAPMFEYFKARALVKGIQVEKIDEDSKDCSIIVIYLASVFNFASKLRVDFLDFFFNNFFFLLTHTRTFYSKFKVGQLMNSTKCKLLYPHHKMWGGGAILDSLCPVRPSVSNSCPLYNSFTNGRISFKLE